MFHNVNKVLVKAFVLGLCISCQSQKLGMFGRNAPTHAAPAVATPVVAHATTTDYGDLAFATFSQTIHDVVPSDYEAHMCVLGFAREARAHANGMVASAVNFENQVVVGGSFDEIVMRLNSGQVALKAHAAATKLGKAVRHSSIPSNLKAAINDNIALEVHDAADKYTDAVSSAPDFNMHAQRVSNGYNAIFSTSYKELMYNAKMKFSNNMRPAVSDAYTNMVSSVDAVNANTIFDPSIHRIMLSNGTLVTYNATKDPTAIERAATDLRDAAKALDIAANDHAVLADDKAAANLLLRRVRELATIADDAAKAVRIHTNLPIVAAARVKVEAQPDTSSATHASTHAVTTIPHAADVVADDESAADTPSESSGNSASKKTKLG